MTNETYEERMALEKAKRKREAELEEAMLLGFIAGNVGGAYMMEAATDLSGGYD
jgi:hypothetical protein